ncbi:MAG: EpsG family protein [Turicibacter sp.]
MAVYIILWVISFCNAVFIPKKIKFGGVVFISCLFFCLVIFRGQTVDRDYATYLKYIDEIGAGHISTLGGMLFDNVVSFFIFLGIPSFFVIIFYALSLPIKISLFCKTRTGYGSQYLASVFLVYVGFFVYLHDFTQIRVSLAIAIAYYAIYYMIVLRAVKKAWFMMGLSIVVHPSLMILCVSSFVLRRLSFRTCLFFLVSSVIGCYLGVFNAIVNEIIVYLNVPILLIYKGLSQDGIDTINVFGLFPLLNFTVAFLVCVYGIRYKIGDPWMEFMVKCSIISQIVWFSFSAIPALSGRISQIFLFSFVFVIPYFSQKIIRNAWGLSALYSLIGFAAFLFKGELLSDYSFIFE